MNDKRKTRLRRAGFTLIELMVALVIGALVVIAVFTLGGASSRHFQEQQRIGVTQRSVRMAMDRIRRDIARAGYLSVSDTLPAPNVRMCPIAGSPRRVQAIWFQNADATGTTALDAVNGPQNGVSADRLRLTGNYASGEQYLVRAINGNTILLQTSWLGFRRTFVSNASGAAQIDVTRFNDVFRAGRMLHVETQEGTHFLVDITGSTANAGGTVAQITVSPSLGGDNICLRGFGRGAVVSPVSQIEYFVGQPGAGSNLAPRAQAVTGANTVLYRQELDPTTNTAIAGTLRPVLEYAIDFNLDFIVDTALPTAQPNLVRLDDAAAVPNLQNSPWQVRSVLVSLAARTPEQDIRFPWPEAWAGGRPADQPLNRYLVFPNQPGAARVRQLRTEVHVPNLAR